MVSSWRWFIQLFSKNKHWKLDAEHQTNSQQLLLETSTVRLSVCVVPKLCHRGRTALTFCCSLSQLFTCVVTLPSLQRMGQRGGLSEEAAQAPQSAGPLLLLPFRLLRHPPVLWGESWTHTLDTTRLSTALANPSQHLYLPQLLLLLLCSRSGWGGVTPS